MTLMIAEIYDAFKATGVDDEKARKAAEAVAAYEHEFASIKSDLRLLKWMIGTNAAATLAVLGIVLQILLRSAPHISS